MLKHLAVPVAFDGFPKEDGSLWLELTPGKSAFHIQLSDIEDHFCVCKWEYNPAIRDWSWLTVTKEMLELELEQYVKRHQN